MEAFLTLRKFEDCFIPEPNSGCFLWVHAQRGNYGLWKRRLAHRESWIRNRGRLLSSKICVCHSCDVPLCVNPDHLFIGTSKQNTQDAIKKGRRKVVKRGKGTPRKKRDLKEVIEDLVNKTGIELQTKNKRVVALRQQIKK
jgi:HNH endonuclease